MMFAQLTILVLLALPVVQSAAPAGGNSPAGKSAPQSKPASAPPSAIVAGTLTREPAAFARKVDGFGKVRPSNELVVRSPKVIVGINLLDPPKDSGFTLNYATASVGLEVKQTGSKPLEICRFTWKGNELRFGWNPYFESAAAKQTAAAESFLGESPIQLKCGTEALRVEPPRITIEGKVTPKAAFNHHFAGLSKQLIMTVTDSGGLSGAIFGDSPDSTNLTADNEWRLELRYQAEQRVLLARVVSLGGVELREVRSDLKQVQRLMNGASEEEKKILESDLERLKRRESDLVMAPGPEFPKGVAIEIELKDESTGLVRAVIHLAMEES